MDSLLPELQFLEKDHHREPDLGILKTLVETIYIILGKGGKNMRTEMKDMGAYLVMRELHLEIEDDGVRAACEKVVDVLMIEDENGDASGNKSKQEQEEERARIITKGSDNSTTAHQNPTTGITSSEDNSILSGKEQSPQLAKYPSDPPSTAPLHDIDDDDDDDDNRIVDIF